MNPNYTFAPFSAPFSSVAGLLPVAAGLVLSAAATAFAQPVLITSPTTVGPLDTEIMSSDGTLVPLETAEITVQGTTLTINGRHDIAWLALESSATVTHDVGFVFDYSMGAGTDIVSGVDLAVLGDVSVDLTSSISVNGRGFGSDEGPGAGGLEIRAGGGGHGGEGGNGRNGAGGEPYGSVLEPVTFGSGGGTDTDGGVAGKPGGGAIRLIVSGTLSVEGFIQSNGVSRSSREEGGGAGGSVWIQAGALAGTVGTIRANGGNGEGNNSGAGSGGRIAIYADAPIPAALLERTSAQGGDGWSSGLIAGDGAAGTIYLEEAGIATLIIDNLGRSGRVTALTDSVSIPQPFDGNLVIVNQGKMGSVDGERFEFSMLGDATVGVGGFITASGRGFGSDDGSGAGQLGIRAGGGGHGGEGGNGRNGAGGEPYGSVLEPVTFGSGGGTDTDAGVAGRPGGGAIRLDVAGTLTVTGIIESNGFSRSSAEEGGGAGGSVWIQAGALAGTVGTIRANGGNGEGNNSGAGSGGRIAIYADAPIPAALLERTSAQGGDGWSSGLIAGDGAAGTIYLEEAGIGTFIIDNNGRDGRVTALTDSVSIPQPFDGNLVIMNQGKMGPVDGERFEFSMLGDATVGVGGFITARGRGFGSDEGPGAGQLGIRAGGGGHGGEGGNGRNGAGGEPYGSVLEPVMFGSGGGTDTDAGVAGWPGGGAIRLVVGGTLTVTGIIESNGFSRSSAEEGGGAGGSVWIQAGALAGTVGTIRANGGNGEGNNSGAGSGGRIAIYTDASIPAALLERISAQGGDGWSSGLIAGDGAAGTIYLEEAGIATLIIDNNGRDGRVTAIGTGVNEFEPDGTFALDSSLIVRGVNTRFGPKAGQFVHFDMGGDVLVASGARFTATGRGFATAEGPGAGQSGRNWGGGGGHGGKGGNGRSDDPAAIGGMPYGLDTYPVTAGSGGGRDPDGGAAGGAGGGAFRLSVGGELTVNGTLDANGLNATGQEAGGGAGGSIWIEAGRAAGVNFITANGGNGASAGGGGAGGYVAVYSCDVAPFVELQANGGGSGSGQRGEDGRVLFGSDSVTITQQPPAWLVLLPGSRMELTVEASGSGPLSYQWRRDGEDLVDGGRVSGATTDMLVITDLGVDDSARYDVFITDLCGPRPSTPTIVEVECRADIDGDGELTIFDFLAFQNLFDAGDLEADFDGDGQLTIFDFLAFQNAFDAGCP